MSDTGYSAKPLIQKLGYEPSQTVYMHNPPEWFPEELALNNVTPSDNPESTWIHAFFTSQKELDAFMDTFDPADTTKGVWVSWPKKSSGVATDLTEQRFRDAILPTGWVDTKVCAIDETWSGLKFLRRKA